MTMTSPSNMLWDLLQAQPHDEESIMQCLYDHPDCCSLVIDDKLAIYVAIEQCLSMDIIKQMLICYPACCSRKNMQGNLLLHKLLLSRKFHIPPDVMYLIIDGNLEAVQTKYMQYTDISELPLHMECKNRCRYDVIVKLLQLYPEAITLSSMSYLPLHAALSNVQACSSDVIMHLIDANSDAVRIGGVFDHLPLQMECENHCRYDVIVKLLSIYPDAISIPNRYGRYPLQYVINNDNSSTKVVLYLFKLFPESVQQNSGGFLLHIECYKHCRYEVIIKLLDIYPAAINIANSYGNLPLHALFLRDGYPPIQVIQLLVDRFPGALKETDYHGWLPLYRLFDKYHDQYVSPYVSRSSKLSMQYKALILSMINSCPLAVDSHQITYHMNRMEEKPSACRLLLLLAYANIKHHVHDLYVQYSDINKKYRYPLLHLLLQLSSLSPSQQVSCDMTLVRQSNVQDVALCNVLLCMLSAAGRWMTDHCSDDEEDKMRYGWMKEDDLGSMLLSKVVLYL